MIWSKAIQSKEETHNREVSPGLKQSFTDTKLKAPNKQITTKN